MAKSIYRGYDIEQKEDGKFYVSVGDQLCDGGGGPFNSEDDAMSAIDSRRRSRVAAGLSAVGA